MTVEFSSCNNITITSDFLQDYVDGLVYKIELSIDINCCNKPFTEQLDAVDITNNTINIDPSYFGFEEVLPNGVYKVGLTAYYGTEENNTSIQGDIKCKFHNCDLTCSVIDHVANTPDTEAHLHLFLLDSMGECPCQCDNMCEVYKLLLEELNKSTEENDKIECWTCKK